MSTLTTPELPSSVSNSRPRCAPSHATTAGSTPPSSPPRTATDNGSARVAQSAEQRHVACRHFHGALWVEPVQVQVGERRAAPTRRRARVSRRHPERRRSTGTKVFCSGAGGLDRALVIAQGRALVLRRPRRRRRGRPRLVPRRRDAGVARATACTSTARGRSRMLGGRRADAQPWFAATRSAPRRPGRGCRRGRGGGARRARGQARARRPARARRGPDRHGARRRSTAGSSTPRTADGPDPACVDPAARGGRRRGRDDLRRGRAGDRLAAVRDRHGARPRAPRLRAVRAPAPARPAGRPARPGARRGAARESRGSAPPTSTSSTRSDPDPWDFETSAVRGGEVRRDDRGARKAGASPRALEIGCSIGVLTERLAPHVRRPARDRRRPRRRSTRARAPRSRTSRFERREIPEEFPDGHFDLIVCSEVLYYLDAPALRARRSTATRTGTLLAVHWRRPTERYPLHGRRGPRPAAARASGRRPTRARTAEYALDRFDACGSLIVGGGPAALAAARGYRDAGGDGDVTLVTPELVVPYQPPAALEGVPARRDRRGRPADRAPRPGTRPRRRGAPRRRGRDARSRRAHARARQRRDAALRRLRARHRRRADAPARPRRRPRKACCCCAAWPTPACCATAPATAKTAIVIGSGFIGCEAAASLAMRGVDGHARQPTRTSRTPRGSARRRAGGSRLARGAAGRLTLGSASRRSSETPCTPTATARRRPVLMAARRAAARAGSRRRRGSTSATAGSSSTSACARAPRASTPPATSRSRTTPPRAATWRSSTGARRSTWARSPGRDDRRRRRRAVGRRARLLVDDRRAHAQVRRLGRRLRRGAPRRPRRRRVDGLVRPEGVTVGVLTHERDEDYERGRELVETGAAAAVTLRACVVVPARDEEELIGACIAALAAQQRRRPRRRTRCCSCSTAAPTRPRQRAPRRRRRPDAARDPRATAPASATRAARAWTSRAAAAAAGRADRHHRRRLRRPAPDWLRDAARRGRAGRAGDRRPDRGRRARRCRPPRSPGARRDAARAPRRAAAARGAREHHQFSRRVARASPPRPTRASGGSSRGTRWRTRASSARCGATAIPIERLAAVRVTTSGRRLGRAPRGLAVDLRRNAWLAERSYARRRLPARRACSPPSSRRSA